LNNDVALGTGGTIDLVARGSTLFEQPLVISALKMKIWKKTKVVLGPDTSTTYQLRDAKDRTFNFQEYNDDVGFVKPYWTKSVIVVFKAIANAANNNVVNLTMGATRKYSYVVDSGEQVGSGLINSA